MLPHEKHQLYEFISQQWGADWAARLMDMLPEHTADQLASKDDVALSAALLKTEMVEMRTELKTEIADLRTELKTEMHQGFAGIDRRMAEQTRFLMISMMTLWLTSLGAMIAVVKLG